MAYCEDYPCCGHTPSDPCDRQWYDEPDAFDTRKNPHALCDHENGECNVEEYDECPDCGDTDCAGHEDNLTDVEADAMTLASGGWGTDEDYGYYGQEDY